MHSKHYKESVQFFTYKSDHPTPINGYTIEEWESLSPGMRRAIVLDYVRTTRQAEQKLSKIIQKSV